MKKLLFIIPIIFGTFCITPSFADGIDDALLGKDKTGNSCASVNANTTICWRNSGGSAGNRDCGDNFKNGDDCTSWFPGQDYAICQDILMNKTTKETKLRCTAKICKPGYYLWVSSRRLTHTPISYEDYKSEGICIPGDWCKRKENCPDCENPTLHTFDWDGIEATDEICYDKKTTPNNDTKPAPDSDPGLGPQNDKGCNLTFADGQTIENVDWAESAKPGYDDTNNKITLIKTPVRNITSIYTNKDKEIIKQNESGFIANYDENAPHLFDLTHINNSQIPQTERDKYTDAVAIIFKCNNGKPEITPIVSVPVPDTPNPNNGTTLSLTCERGTQCQKFDVFSAIDEQISYLQGRDFFTGSSVWKTDAGKFNTARLASDSIAGVVLGTAGGIITSKIVKKNQIKNGFEDLKCTIGGQVVATYGDEFTVNVK